MKNFINDIKTAAGVFRAVRNARKDGGEIVVMKKARVPFVRSGGFYGTVEGLVLGGVDKEIERKAKATFSNLPDEVKYRLQFAPKEGEYMERARLWKSMMAPVMAEKECHFAVGCILAWYIHIKRMDIRKGAAEA